MLQWAVGGHGTLAGRVRKQNISIVKLSNLTNMLLDLCFDEPFWFTNIEALAIRHFADGRRGERASSLAKAGGGGSMV